MEVEAADASSPVEAPTEGKRIKGDYPQVEEPETPTQPQPSPPHSNGGADVVTQLRAWQERGARIEQLLAKKNAKMQEMEETENKLKRLLAMAKRSIDNSKQELAEKDDTIQKLREELAKSQQARHSWFMDAPRYVNENELDDSKEFAWHCFHNEEDIQAYANRASGEPLTLPDFSMTPYEVERVKKSMKEEIDRVQEEFRRYRVRSEITRKQKDAEIRKVCCYERMKNWCSAEECGLAVQMSANLQASKAQIRRLTKAQAEAEERESDWRRKFEKLMKDYEKLSGTMGETVLAMEWRERYEQSVREKQELEKKMEEMKLMTSGAFGNGSDSGNGDLQSLRQEFAQYRKRALNAVEQKEKELNDMQAQYHENGDGSSNASRSTFESNSSLSGFETPNATKTNEYLKNIVYKYMASDQAEAKEHMEKAIATVLNFTPAEITAIQFVTGNIDGLNAEGVCQTTVTKRDLLLHQAMVGKNEREFV
ncbi:GRIP protein [Phytophthora cactorum]|nr:GRIP protein [Phytophthora cactorum]